MWGYINDGFCGDFQEKISKGLNILTDFVKMDNLTNLIQDDVRKNDLNYTETYINSKKLLINKYNQTLEDNFNKQNRIEKLSNQINTLKQDILYRQKLNKVKFYNNLLKFLSGINKYFVIKKFR